MVQSRAATVDAFMTEVGPERRPALERLRSLCLEHLTGWIEHMAYGMPAYGPEGVAPPVCFNNQKGYIAFYAGQTAVDTFKDRLGGADCGKGCIRYKAVGKIDFAVVADILKDIRTRNG